ncbi:MAG: hypothetical protein O2992_01845 [Gemmatimonadetes bacterium]|nr:hypothetical protein [Gemmatimonadota bacterium]
MLRILPVRILFVPMLLSACNVVSPPVPLDSLVLQDSVYLDAETMTPFTGRVERAFDDAPGQAQLRGELADGLWNGEIVVYHPSGRVRYMGSLASSEKCGEWVENREDEPPVDVVAELKQEIESLGIYPACPKR